MNLTRARILLSSVEALKGNERIYDHQNHLGRTDRS
jgi:hypothetical protein